MTPIARSRRGSRSAVAGVARRERAQQERRDPGGVQQRLVAIRQRPAHVLALGRPAPLGSGGDRPCVGRETDVDGVAAVALAHQLADVELAACPHLRGAGVTDVRVVLPHHDPGGAAVRSRCASS